MHHASLGKKLHFHNASLHPDVTDVTKFAVRQPTLEMYKKFVLRDVNLVRLLRQNRIFLDSFMNSLHILDFIRLTSCIY